VFCEGKEMKVGEGGRGERNLGNNHEFGTSSHANILSFVVAVIMQEASQQIARDRGRGKGTLGGAG
jgi:hypothetical protein